MITVSLELTDTPIIVRSRNAAESAELEEAFLEAWKRHINLNKG